MPSTPAHDLDLLLPVAPASVPEARHAVERLAREAGVCPGSMSAVRLAISEACTNVVLHAYRDRNPGRMHVHAAVEGRDLRVSVCDQGVGMAPRPDSPGLGLGLPLIASLTDELRVEAEGDANRLTMSFSLDSPPPVFAAVTA